MQAVEFNTELNEQGGLSVPRALVGRLSGSKKVRVIVLIPEGAAEQVDADWSELTAREFLAGYAPGDAIYDQD